MGQQALELLAQACEAGSLPVSSVALLAGSERRAEGREALEIAGYPQAAEALSSWNSRLVEASSKLQSLVASARSLWPQAQQLLTALGSASEAWPLLPVKGALEALKGQGDCLPQVPQALLRCSGPLGLLGNSRAFKAAWKHDATTFDEEQLRPVSERTTWLTRDENCEWKLNIPSFSMDFHLIFLYKQVISSF